MNGGGDTAGYHSALRQRQRHEDDCEAGQEKVGTSFDEDENKIGKRQKCHKPNIRRVLTIAAFVVLCTSRWFCISPSPRVVHSSNTTIPKLIWLTAKEESINNLSENHRNCVESWRKLNPEYQIMYHNDTDAERFMCSPGLLPSLSYCETYRQLPLPVMKADMWRYAILYVHGGIYADVNAEDRVPIRDWGINDRCGLWAGQENNYNLCQWTLAAAPNSPALKSVLDLIVRRFDQRDDQSFETWGFVHNFTGPQVFTDGVELALPLRAFAIPYLESFNRLIATWRIRFASWLFAGRGICIESQSTIRYNPLEGYTTSVVHNHFEWHTGWRKKARDYQKKEIRNNKNKNPCGAHLHN